jgi:hypothetical protein
VSIINFAIERHAEAKSRQPQQRMPRMVITRVSRDSTRWLRMG